VNVRSSIVRYGWTYHSHHGGGTITGWLDVDGESDWDVVALHCHDTNGLFLIVFVFGKRRGRVGDKADCDSNVMLPPFVACLPFPRFSD